MKLLNILKSFKGRIIAAIIAAILALLGIQSCTFTKSTLPEVVNYKCHEHDSCQVFHITLHNKPY